jgi:hypothetical protein
MCAFKRTCRINVGANICLHKYDSSIDLSNAPSEYLKLKYGAVRIQCRRRLYIHNTLAVSNEVLHKVLYPIHS